VSFCCAHDAMTVRRCVLFDAAHAGHSAQREAMQSWNASFPV
jgi:hypothetical protein